MVRHVTITFLLLFFTFSTFAQDGVPVHAFNLDANFLVTDLGIEFFYPSDWVYGVNSGIFFAQNDSDLASVTDDDPDTLPEGTFFSVSAFPLDMFEINYSTPIDEVGNLLIEVVGIEELDRLVNGILARPSISIIGQNDIGRYGIMTLFLRNELLVIFSIGSSDLETLAEAYSFWGALISTISLVETREFSPEPLVLEELGFSVDVPVDWLHIPEEASLLELESDLAIFENNEGVLEGHLIYYTQIPISNLGLDETANLADMSMIIQQNFGDAQEIYSDDYFINFFEPAIGLEVYRTTGSVTFIVGFVVGENLNLILLGSPDTEASDAIYDTWLMLVNSIRVLE